MRVLIINDDYYGGGAENHARWEKQILEQHGHEVVYLTIDPGSGEQDSYEPGHFSLGRKYSPLQSFWYRYHKDRKLFHSLKQHLTQFQPDVVHLHNIYRSSKAVYQAVKGYYCVQTVHDYSIVCVKSTCCDGKLQACEGIQNGNCMGRCFWPSSWKEKIIFAARHLALKGNNKLRRETVKLFISPSQCLANICNQHGFQTVCIRNPFESDLAKPHCLVCNDQEKVFLYFGAVSKVKGIFQLIEAFRDFSVGKPVKLEIIGKIKPDIEQEFRSSIANCAQISYLGAYSHEDVLEHLQTVHTVVTPSLWIENYPTTVLEAMAAGCLVIASNRGGMSEMLDMPECLFDITDKQDIIAKLEYAFHMPEEQYLTITNRQMKRVREMNSAEVYYQELYRVLKQ